MIRAILVKLVAVMVVLWISLVARSATVEGTLAPRLAGGLLLVIAILVVIVFCWRRD